MPPYILLLSKLQNQNQNLGGGDHISEKGVEQRIPSHSNFDNKVKKIRKIMISYTLTIQLKPF